MWKSFVGTRESPDLDFLTVATMDSSEEKLFRQKLELLILTEDEEILNRAKPIISRYYLTFRQMAYATLFETPIWEILRAQMVVMVQGSDEDLLTFAERVDRTMQTLPRSRILTVMSPKLSLDNLEGTQNPRVLPLSRSEFFNTLKFEYLCLCRCRAQYFDIRAGDLFPMTNIGFSVFVRLQLNQRYLAVLPEGAMLTDGRFQRMQESDSVYILRRDVDKYAAYINSYYDRAGQGLVKRIRALFLSLIQASLNLNEVLLFDFKSLTDEDMRVHYEELHRLGKELLELIEEAEDPWNQIREAVSGEFYLLWRSPWIALYAAVISKKTGQGDPLVCILAALLTDLGLFDLQDEISRQFLLDEKRVVDEVHKKAFANHPILSLNRCLLKGLPVEADVKAVMVCTHERHDEQGFPNQVPADKIPVEAQLIQFAEKLDQGVLTTMKNTGVGFRFLREKIWESESKTLDTFSRRFLDSISKAMI